MAAAIEFKNVKKAYGDKTVIENLSLAIEQGEFVTIVGSSGCGKTTALKMINGLIEATDGDILVDGENIRDKDLIELRRNIGYSIQGSYRSCLEIADENNLDSIAFCCISTGVFMFPNKRAAEIAVDTVRAYRAETGSAIKVVFNVFKEEDERIYRRLVK